MCICFDGDFPSSNMMQKEEHLTRANIPKVLFQRKRIVAVKLAYGCGCRCKILVYVFC